MTLHMAGGIRTSAGIAGLAVAVALLYGWQLSKVPAYLDHDEIKYGLSAWSIAETGRDLNGRLFPLYFELPGVWTPPAVVYAASIPLKLWSLTEFTVRLSSMVVGTLDVILMYFIGRRLFGRVSSAFLAASLLALTPSHFIQSRLLLDNLYPVPFVLGWLLCLLIYFDRRMTGWLFAAGSLLGLGVYTYHASVVTMPLSLVITMVALYQWGLKSARPYIVVTLGFLWPLLFLVPWLITHPSHYADEVGIYGLYNARQLNPLQGARELASWVSLTERVGVYYNYFNPSFLFFAGDVSPVHSTRQAGVFLMPLAVLIPVGLHHILTKRKQLTMVVLGFLIAPAAAVAIVSSFRIARACTMLPFGALLAAQGAEVLFASPRRWVRVAALVLIAALPLQFGLFYSNYFTDYARYSSGAFGGNLRGAIEMALDHDRRQRTPIVYLSDAIVDLEYYWQFYLTKIGRRDLLDRSRRFDSSKELGLDELPPGTLFIVRASDERWMGLERAGDVRLLANVPEPFSDAPRFALFIR